jgi:CIC family chloride channel protein
LTVTGSRDIRPRLRAQAGKLADRQRWRILVGSALVGLTVGAFVSLFYILVEEELLPLVLEAPPAAQVVIPVLGILVGTAILRFKPRQSPATSDAYIASYHDNDQRLGGWSMVRRTASSAVSLGAGAPLGLEGPSIYIGATVGALFRRRLQRLLHGTEARVFLVAGAAAGVATVFRAPATGAIFALEVPYQSDIAPRVELPAMTAAAASYLMLTVTTSTDRLFQLVGNPPIVAADLLGAIAVGLVAGLAARLFSKGIVAAKKIRFATKPYFLALICLPLGIWTAYAISGRPLGLSGGGNVVEWLQDADLAVWMVLSMLAIRAIVTLSAFSMGTVGGVFIPLVSMGAICGKLVGSVIESPDTITFVLVGAAAFLAAGYRTPLAALMFVAETTGRPGFIVPGLIGVVAAQFAAGNTSVSTAQRKYRVSRLERRSAMPVTAAMSRTLKDIAPETSLEAFVQERIPEFRERVLPVTSEGRYLGVAVLDDALVLDRDDWESVRVADIVRTVPTADSEWTVGAALAAMETAGLDQLPVVDGSTLLGMIRRRDLQRWDELLERTERTEP